MNHCESYEPLLDAFTEGDLFMEDMVWVQQHLNNCPDCLAYVEDLMAIRAVFPTVEEAEVPAGFTASVMAAVAATPQATAPKADAASVTRSAKKRTPWVKVLSGLAACCAIAILAQGGLRMASGGGASMAPQAEEAAPAAEAPMETYMADSVTESAAEEGSFKYEAKLAEPEMEAITDSEFFNDGAADVTHPAAGTTEGVVSPYRIIITVDADYIGDALYYYLPVVEYDELLEGSDTPVHTREYELTMAEYDALLKELANRDELPAEEGFDTDSETVLVIVRQ